MHDDEHPSLSIAESPSGEILLKCFAGCDTAEILRWLRERAGLDRQRASRRGNTPESREGLSLEEYARAKQFDVARLREWHLYDDSYPKDGRPCVRIEYRNEQGEVACIQYRLRLEGDPRFVWREGDSGAIYGLWRVPEFSGRQVWLLEGATDCLALWHAGAAALALPSASAKRELLEQAWGILARFEQVYVCFDSDRAGRELLQRFSNACPSTALRERVKVVRLPDGVKDAGDLWVSVGGDANAFKVELARCLQNAQPLPEPQAGEPSPMRMEEDVIPTLGFDELEEISATPLLPPLLYENAISLLVGLPGSGKTTLAAQISDELERGGELWGMQLPRGRVLWVAYDHHPTQLKAMMNGYYGERPRPGIRFVSSEWQEPLTPQTLYRWKNLIQKFQPNLIVLDTLFHFLGVQDEIRDAEARQGLALIRDLLEGTNACVLGLHHPRKASPESLQVYAASGHMRWTAGVDVVAFLHPLRKDGYPPDRVVKLAVRKNRHGESGWEREFERVARRFVPLQKGDTLTEWDVVRSYLQQHHEAEYDELLCALRNAGYALTERTLQRRLQRWEEFGLLRREGVGFPRRVVVRLSATINLVGIPGKSGESGESGESGGSQIAPDTTITPPDMSGKSGESGESVEVQAAPDLPDLPDTTDMSGVEVASLETSLDDPDLRAWLSANVRPDDPLGLEPPEIALLCNLWHAARQCGFPAVVISRYGYTISSGREAWLQALPDIAGTPAVRDALAALDPARSRAGQMPHELADSSLPA